MATRIPTAENRRGLRKFPRTRTCEVCPCDSAEPTRPDAPCETKGDYTWEELEIPRPKHHVNSAEK